MNTYCIGPMHTTFYKRPATRVLETRVAGRFSPTVQFVVVCIDTNARHQRVCIDNTRVCIASASLHTRVCIATHARQVCKGLQAASNYRVCSDTDAIRTQVSRQYR
ncbi:hypothetical protein SFRURICE_011971 [Spodoptera frugiperda]|nr:hypothetical protein SFRURICE_011971 [Spodoptera frugiperda]